MSPGFSHRWGCFRHAVCRGAHSYPPVEPTRLRFSFYNEASDGSGFTLVHCQPGRSPLFFFFLFDSPVVPTPPVKSSSSSCSVGCGCPCPSPTHAFTRKVLTERRQVPWLPPRPCAGDFPPSSGSPPALCPKRCASQQGLAASAAPSVCVPGTGGDPHHSLLRRQAVPAAPAEVRGVSREGHSVQQQDLTFLFLILGRKTLSLLVLLPK